MIENYKKQFIENLQEGEAFEEVVERHFLEPYLYKDIDFIESKKKWHQKVKATGFRNQLLLNELNEWKEKFSDNISPCLLKGISFLDRIYEVNERPMTDVDLYVSEEEKLAMVEILRNRGFSFINEDHGPANQSKSMWKKPLLDSEFVVELHSKLYWYEPKNIIWQRESSVINGYSQLSTIDEIIYLSVHLAYQHNFQRLFWLIDIFELIQKSEIDWPNLSQRARENKAEKAVAAALYAIEKMYSYKFEKWPLSKKYLLTKWLITKKFLQEPYGSLLRYTILKHHLQDSFKNALLYDYYRLGISWRRLGTRLFSLSTRR